MIDITSLSAIEHILNHRPDRILGLQILTKPDAAGSRALALVDLAKENGINVTHASAKNKGDVLSARIGAFPFADLKTWLQTVEKTPRGLVLALDHIQDPQNLGALIRTAEAMGVLGVIIPRDRSAPITASVYSASVGAVETVPLIQVGNLNEALRKLKDSGFWIVGAALTETSKPIKETPTFEKKVLVLGTELEGLSNLTLKTCDWLTAIPISGKVQSLNVSAAGAILMYEFSKE